MKKVHLLSLAVTLLLSASICAQDFSRLEKLADGLKDQAGKLARTASGGLNRKKPNSPAAVEAAILAEQFLAGARFMRKMIGDRYDIGDLRLAGNALSAAAGGFPASGRGAAAWNRTRERLDALLSELARSPETDQPVEKHVDSSRILGRFFWNGGVDNEVLLSITGATITSQTVTGRNLPDGTYSFTSLLPGRGTPTVAVRKKDGRGRVSVIQQPDAANGYTAVLRIRDTDKGSDSYSLEIFWY